MRYRIIAANRDTGQIFKACVEADSDVQAEQMLLEKGWLVSSVEADSAGEIPEAVVVPDEARVEQFGCQSPNAYHSGPVPIFRGRSVSDYVRLAVGVGVLIFLVGCALALNWGLHFFSITVMVVGGIVLYVGFALVPWGIAVDKRHPHAVAILCLSLVGTPFGGIPWVAAAIWALVLPRR